MKNTIILLITFLVLIPIGLTACTATTTEKTLYVGPELVDCVGVAPQKCLLVKENPEDEWSLFYGQIEGFDYEEGYNYKLLVEERVIENPPADASSIELTLIEVISKTEATTLENTMWVLESYGEQGDLQDVLEGSEITAVFAGAGGQVSGSAGCNSYFASYEIETNELSISDIGSTRKFCEGFMEQEGQYLAILADAESFQIQDSQLQIFSSGNQVLIYDAR